MEGQLGARLVSHLNLLFLTATFSLCGPPAILVSCGGDETEVAPRSRLVALPPRSPLCFGRAPRSFAAASRLFATGATHLGAIAGHEWP